MLCFFFQAEDGIRDLVRSRGLGDVYKRQEVQHLRQHVGIVFGEGETQADLHVARLAGPDARERRLEGAVDLSLIHI